MPARFPEIDQARGVAIIMMVVFHIAFDLYFLGIAPIPANQGLWRLLALSTASLFLFLVGISLSISSAYAARTLTRREFILKYVSRGGFILSLGLLITAVTWLLIPGGFIRFGILHLIGIAVMMSPLYIRYLWPNLIVGAVIIALGPLVAGLRGNSLLLWAGIHPEGFASIDYTPLVPWFGVVLIGVFAGKLLYPGGMRRPGFSVAGVILEAAGGKFSKLDGSEFHLIVYLDGQKIEEPLLVASSENLEQVRRCLRPL